MDPKLGGVCQAVRIIISGLTELGVHNEVVSLDAANSAFLNQDSFQVHAVGLGTGPWSHNPNLIPSNATVNESIAQIICHASWNA
jgi:hypothetical protein